MTLPQINPSDEILLQQLKQVIVRLEQDKADIEKQIHQFQTVLRLQLHEEIEEVSTLTTLYKQHQKAKKEKRLEQKKRGKNYVAPKQIILLKQDKFPLESCATETQNALKRMYREAVVKVHPDKIEDQNEADKIKHASDLTAQLNNIYKSGDLEELSYFYYNVILSQPGKLPVAHAQTKAQKETLLQKKKRLTDAIADLRNSYSYQVLTTYKNPADFVNELRAQFADKIQKLKKRTRKIR